MRFEVETGQEYDIRFQYKTSLDLTVTTCVISFVNPTIKSGPEKYHELMRGTAQQSFRDTFNKDVGRRVALARAVSILPKKNRKLAWEAYLNRSAKSARLLARS